MAGHGPPPKPESQRRRRNKPPTDETVLPDDGELRGPELPELEEPWPPATLAWWETWRRSALAQTFSATDWDFLADTALLHAALWGDGNTKVAAELRLRVAKFGATPEDRLRLRVGLVPDAAPVADAKPEPSTRRQAGARKQRILKVVADGEAG